MDKAEKAMEALNRAVEMLEGVNSFARAMKQPQSKVSNWKARRSVPAKYAPTIERITNGAVRCEEVCPDVEWGYLRGSGVGSNKPQTRTK